MELFKGIMAMIDIAQDKYLEPYVEKEYGKVMGAMGLILLVLMAVALVVMMTGLHGSKIVQPVYLFAPKDGEPRRAVVIDSPSLSHAKIKEWSANAIRDMYTFTFRDVDGHADRVRQYFDPATAESFIATSQALRDEVKNNQLFNSLVLLEEPAVVNQLQVGGSIIWVVEMSGMITTIGGREPKYTEYMFEIYVKQVPTTESPEGIKIIRKRYGPNISS